MFPFAVNVVTRTAAGLAPGKACFPERQVQFVEPYGFWIALDFFQGGNTQKPDSTICGTFATRLLELNEHPKIVQELLGHAKITTTIDTYSHVDPELKKKAAARLNELFRRKKEASPKEV